MISGAHAVTCPLFQRYQFSARLILDGELEENPLTQLLRCSLIEPTQVLDSLYFGCHVDAGSPVTIKLTLPFGVDQS